MKQATIQITFEEEKLRALRRYIAKRDSTLEAELQKAAQRLYEKVVPAGAERTENTGRINGAYELDFDARTFSALNIMDGWKDYAMQDMADAAEQAFQEAEMPADDRWRIFLGRLDGRELTTPS